MELENLQKIVAKILNVDLSEVVPETTFAEDLGADSLDFYQIVLEIEKVFAIQIDKERIEELVTVQDVIDLIRK